MFYRFISVMHEDASMRHMEGRQSVERHSADGRPGKPRHTTVACGTAHNDSLSCQDWGQQALSARRAALHHLSSIGVSPAEDLSHTCKVHPSPPGRRGLRHKAEGLKKRGPGLILRQ